MQPLIIISFLLFFSALLLCMGALVFKKKAGAYEKKNKDFEKEVTIQNVILASMTRQQQVLYDLSTSVFLLTKEQDIIKNVLTELSTMYVWKDVAYLPCDEKLSAITINKPPEKQRGEIFNMVSKNMFEDKEIRNGSIEHVAYVTVEKQNVLLGILYVNNGSFALSLIQLHFAKTVANFLAIAIENTRKQTK